MGNLLYVSLPIQACCSPFPIRLVKVFLCDIIFSFNRLFYLQSRPDKNPMWCYKGQHLSFSVLLRKKKEKKKKSSFKDVRSKLTLNLPIKENL